MQWVCYRFEKRNCFISEQNNTIFFQPLPINCGVPAADTIFLQPVLSWTSSFVVPIDLVSVYTVHPSFFGLPLLLPFGTKSSVCLLAYSLSFSSRVQTTSVLLSCTSLWCSLPSVSGVIISHIVSQYVAATHLHPRHFQSLHVWDSHQHCTEHNTKLLYYLYICKCMVCQGLCSIKFLTCYLHYQCNYGHFLSWWVFGILIMVNYWYPI